LPDTLGCRSDTVRKTVTVNKKVWSGFGIAATTCNNTPVQLYDSANATNTTIARWVYELNNGDSAVSNTSGTLQMPPLPPGSYTLAQTATSIEGCRSDTAIRIFTVYAKPNAAFGLPQNCVLDRSLFTDSSTAPTGSTITAWHWNFGDAWATATNPDTAVLQNPWYQYQ